MKEGARREEVCANGCWGRFVCYRNWFVCLFVVWRRFKDKERRTEL